MPARCSCIIVDYRTPQWAQQLRHWLMVDPRLEVLVIDAAALQTGYGASVNAGLRHATGQYVAVLNADIMIAPAGIERLCAVLDTRPEVGMVGPAITHARLGVQITCSAVPSAWQSLVLFSFLHDWPLLRRLQTWYRLGGFDHRSSRAVPSINGSCMVFRRQDLLQLGGWNEQLFLYFEEFDLAKRFAQLGKTAWFEASVSALHIGQAATAQVAATQVFFRESRRRWLQTYYGQSGRLVAWLLAKAEAWCS